MKNPRLFWTSLALARGTGLSGIESSSWHLEACILKVPRWNSFWTQLFSDLAARQSSSMHLAAWLARWDLAASPSRWASSFNLKIWHIEKSFLSLLPRFPWLTRRIALKMVRCHLLAELESKLLICLELKSFPTYVQCDMTPLTFLRWRCISSLCNLGRGRI